MLLPLYKNILQSNSKHNPVTYENDNIPSVQFNSFAQSCLTLCDHMDYSMPGFPVHRQLPELAKLMDSESVMSQDSFPLGLTGLISLQSKGLSRIFSNIAVQNIISWELNFLYGPTLTSILDYCKNHSFDYMDPCQQSNVSAF